MKSETTGIEQFKPPSGSRKQCLRIKLRDFVLLSTLLLSNGQSFTLYDVKAQGRNELLKTLPSTEYLSSYPLPKGLRIVGHTYSPTYSEGVKKLKKKKRKIKGIDKELRYMKGVIERLKILEESANLNGDSDLQKKYHQKVVDLYVKIMKDIPFAPTEYSGRKHFFEHMSSYELEAYATIYKDKIFEIYAKNPETKDICNVDEFRKFLGEDVGVSADDTLAAAGYLTRHYYDYLLDHNLGVGNNTIKFLVGGAGSGKSSISTFNDKLHSDFSGIFDGIFKSYDVAESFIKKAIDKGYNIRIEFVYRDMTDAFINGVLQRTIKQNQYYKSQGKGDFIGRTVPLERFESGHKGARSTILKLYEKYGDRIVKFFGGLSADLPIGNGILDKVTGTPGKGPKYIYEFSYEYIRERISNDVLDIESCKMAVEEVYLKGYISLIQKKALLGKYL